MNDCASVAMRRSMACEISSSSVRSANSSSSWSEKSSSSSSSEVSLSSWPRRSDSSPEKFPRSWPMAMWWVALLVAAMRSATASAWLRSILPLRKARCVYSPGLACRHPLSVSRCSTLLRM